MPLPRLSAGIIAAPFIAAVQTPRPSHPPLEHHRRRRHDHGVGGTYRVGSTPRTSPAASASQLTTSTPSPTAVAQSHSYANAGELDVHTDGCGHRPTNSERYADSDRHPENPPCRGDCNGGHSVTVDELLAIVNIALGNANVSTCLAGDANHDNEITIDEILTAANNALSGCSGG